MPKLPTSATIPLPRISLGKTKARSQIFDIATLDGRVVTQELSVLGECADEVKSGHAFLVDPDNQYLNEDNQWVQVAGESSAVPMTTIIPREIKEQEKLIDKIFADTDATETLAQFEDRGKSAIADKILWLIGMPVIGSVLICGLIVLKKHWAG